MTAKARKIRQGKYEHYKGKNYKVLGIALHSETLEKLVVYQALYRDNKLWARPIDMSLEKVEVNSKKVPRFKYIDKIV